LTELVLQLLRGVVVAVRGLDHAAFRYEVAKSVHEMRVVPVLFDDVLVHRDQLIALKEVLKGEKVEAFLLKPLQHLLFL
jgi:hypothetical protein